MTDKAKSNKRTRLNMRIHDELVTWVKKYAKKKKTSVTQIVIDHFVNLREQKSAQSSSINR